MTIFSFGELAKEYLTGNKKKIAELTETISSNKHWEARARDLERSIEKQFGIKVRNEIIEVKTNFTKVELILMSAGVERLLKESKNSSDTEMYIKLRDKIMEVAEKMEDE